MALLRDVEVASAALGIAEGTLDALAAEGRDVPDRWHETIREAAVAIGRLAARGMEVTPMEGLIYEEAEAMLLEFYRRASGARTLGEFDDVVAEFAETLSGGTDEQRDG